MRESYGGGGENKRGFHNPPSERPDHNRGASTGGGAPHGGAKKAGEPTNHGGHTYSGVMQAAHTAAVEHMRGMHAGKGQMDHEKILHQTHKLHQGGDHNVLGSSKHGAEHHV